MLECLHHLNILIFYGLIKFSWKTWRLLLNKDANSTREPLMRTPELFSESAHQVGLWTYLDTLSLDQSWRWVRIRYFSPGHVDLVFSTPVVECCSENIPPYPLSSILLTSYTSHIPTHHPSYLNNFFTINYIY